MIYNCLDGTIIDINQKNGIWIYTVKDKYNEIVSKNINIDIFNDKLRLTDLLDEYNIVKISLEQYEYSDLKDNIHSISKKLINLHVIDCNKLILDSKLINKDNITIQNLVPYVDYRYINQFKDTINELEDNISFNEIIVYLPDKYIWSDIIYDFKNLTQKLKLVTYERGLYISSNVEPYTNLSKINIINQLWTTFDLTVDICMNELGDTIDSKLFSNDINQGVDDISLDIEDIEETELLSDIDYQNDIDNYISTLEDPFKKEMEVPVNKETENDFYSNYGFLEKDNWADKEVSEDSINNSIDSPSLEDLFYKYEVNFAEDSSNPEISKKPLEFLKRKDLFWFDIINTFINKTPNIYGINLISDESKYIIPNKINNISNFNPNLSKIKIIENYSNINGIISDIFDCSLDNYTKEVKNITKKG